jgi:hypothetical protein
LARLSLAWLTLALLWGLTLSLTLARVALPALGLRWALARIALALSCCLLALVPIGRRLGLGVTSPILRALLAPVLGGLILLSPRALTRRLLALTTLLTALSVSLRSALPLLVRTRLTRCLFPLAALLRPLSLTLALLLRALLSLPATLLRALLGLPAAALGRLLVLRGAGLSATAHSSTGSSAHSSAHSLGRRHGNSCQQRSRTE